MLRAIIEEGDAEIPLSMQKLALTEGALPSHLYKALYTRTTGDGRLLGQRQLSRHLVGLWTTGHEEALELIERILPRGLLAALQSDECVSLAEVDHLSPRDNLALAAAAEREALAAKSQVLATATKVVKTAQKKVEQLAERHADKLETVEKSLQPATQQINKYYEQYLEKHVDVSTCVFFSSFLLFFSSCFFLCVFFSSITSSIWRNTSTSVSLLFFS